MLGRIQRIDGPFPGVLCLTVYRSGEGKRVLLFDERGLHVATARPRGRDADAFVQRLRRRYAGARLVALERCKNRLRLRLQTKEADEFIDVSQGMLVARDEAGCVIAARRRAATHPWADDDEWPAVADEPTPWKPAPSRLHEMARRRLKAARKRLARTRRKVEAELKRAETAPSLRHDADLLMAHLHVEPIEGELRVHDWESDSARTLPLKGSAHATAEELYHRARRFERGAGHAKGRLADLDSRATRLDSLQTALSNDDLPQGQLVELFASVGIRFEESPRARAQASRLPYRLFQTPRGRILVGRSARDNDELTLRVARPGDHWLHVRGRPGSHVVVPLEKGEAIDAAHLVDAAQLAAHFSTGNKDANVDVSHTERRYVRKRRGTPAGSVFLEREKTVRLRKDMDRIRELLAFEVK